MRVNWAIAPALCQNVGICTLRIGCVVSKLVIFSSVFPDKGEFTGLFCNSEGNYEVLAQVVRA